MTTDPTIRHAQVQPSWLRGLEVTELHGADAAAQWHLAQSLQAKDVRENYTPLPMPSDAVLVRAARELWRLV